MVKGLLILNSSITGSRDLWWPPDPAARRGYNVYRAYDAPVNWRKINSFSVPGQYYRDQTSLEPVRFNVTPDNWIDAGEMGQKCLRLPEVPYSRVEKGRAQVAAAPQDVSIEIMATDGTVSYSNPAQINGLDQTIWLNVGRSLPYGGAADLFPTTDFTTVAGIAVLYRRLSNFVDISTNMVRTFYAVIPITLNGEEHAPGAHGSDVVNSMEVDNIDYILAEMVRRNQWLLEQAAEPAHLMFRRTCGDACPCSSEFTKGRTACPVCFETGIRGGFYGPFEFLFLDPDVAATRTIDEGGVKVERQSSSFLTRTPIVQDGDLVIRRNGERLVISGVTYKMPRGVLVQQSYNVELLPPGDTRYLIPLHEPENPIIFNPASQQTAGPGSQPVYQDSTMPGKSIENRKPGAGRTITFGRIQG